MDFVRWGAVAGLTILSAVSAAHALLFKRDPRAALGWIAVCLLLPFAGPLLYFLFGINRTRTRARKLEQRAPFRLLVDYEGPEAIAHPLARSPDVPAGYEEVVRISDAVTRQPLVAGNEVAVLHNGEEAFPAMLAAIDAARESVWLATYIFETNPAGERFIDALARATRRGVDVRVLLDGIGELYSRPRAGRRLRRERVRVARFLPPRLFPPSFHVNLRNHRKILVCDGAVGFTGGMNLGDRHLAGDHRPDRVVDAHFRLAGPVVAQMENVFLDDWAFATGERTAPRPRRTGSGGAYCRTIVDGPNEDLDKLSTILAGAVSSARVRVAIMTPYFLPPRELVVALQVAALRGADVSVILPERNNLPYVAWATRHVLWELLQWNVRVYYQPPPFVHTKMLLVDDAYAQIGSANLDPRSLRLNFEIAVEVIDRSFAAHLGEHYEATRRRSREVSLREMRERPLPLRARDALAALFSPYL